MPLDSKLLQYRELGVLDKNYGFVEQLIAESDMRKGMLYIDGPHLMHDFGLQSKLIAKLGSPLTIIGNLKEKRLSLEAP